MSQAADADSHASAADPILIDFSPLRTSKKMLTFDTPQTPDLLWQRRLPAMW